MPSLDALQAFYQERQSNTVHYLTDLQDSGPEELNLSEYINADLFQTHSEACMHRRIERRQARKHKGQSFNRRA